MNNLASDSMKIYITNANGYATVRYQNDASLNWYQGLGGSTASIYANKWYLLGPSGSFVYCSTGNIGINNVNPTVTIDVNGTIFCSCITSGNASLTNISSSNQNSNFASLANITSSNLNVTCYNK